MHVRDAQAVVVSLEVPLQSFTVYRKSAGHVTAFVGEISD